MNNALSKSNQGCRMDALCDGVAAYLTDPPGCVLRSLGVVGSGQWSALEVLDSTTSLSDTIEEFFG